MPEDQAYDLLDDIDFYYNKVKCRKIEKLLPVLNKLVIEEQKFLCKHPTPILAVWTISVTFAPC